MFKRLLLITMCCGLILSLAACSDYTINDSSPPSVSTERSDPFAAAENETAFLGAIGHGESSPNRAEDQSKIPFEYNGGEFVLEYNFHSEGNLGGVGFLMFLDGVPQAYKVDDAQAEYEYCHTFPVENAMEKEFSFIFTPCMGNAGETLNLTIVSITNPDFQPNMEQSSSYGWYHQILSNEVELHFNADAVASEHPATEELFSSVNVSEEKITTSFLENDLAKNGWGSVTLDTLNDGVYYTISYDGNLVYDNIHVGDQDTLSVRFALCGAAGSDYQVSFLADHQPISNNAVLSYQASVTKGNLLIIDAVIDVSRLDDFTTFYVMALPVEDTDSPVYKTNSILLYREA